MGVRAWGRRRRQFGLPLEGTLMPRCQFGHPFVGPTVCVAYHLARLPLHDIMKNKARVRLYKAMIKAMLCYVRQL